MKKKITGFILIAFFLLAGCSFPYEQAVEQVTDSIEIAGNESREEVTEESGGFFSESQDVHTGIQYEQELLGKAKEAFTGLYYYESLPVEEKQIYTEVYLSLKNREEVSVSTLDSEQLDRIYQFVMNDHPEIFYSSGYVCTRHTLGEEVRELTFLGKYDMTSLEVTEKEEAIALYVQNCFGAMPQGLDQYGQVKYIYDYIIGNTQYNLEAENNQNICSVFVNQESVCQGYAKGTQYLLRQLGYEITLVSGEAEGGSHAWNLIKVDGAYYYLDTTWGDVDYQTQEETAQAMGAPEAMPVNYDYFLITTAQLEKTHVIESPTPMPACVTEADNYYVREGLYFTQMDEGKLQEIFQRANETDRKTVTLKAANEAVFTELKNTLLEEQKIFEYVNQTEKVSYYEDSDMGTICFWLER